jgi:hypothetical protein
MSVNKPAGSGVGPSRTAATWNCPRALADSLVIAANRFLDHPADQAAVDAVVCAIKAITAEGPGGSQALERVRQKRLKRDGGFGRRYVAVKWLDPSGQVAPLRERVPARDRIPEQMGRIIAGQPEKYPHGAASFFEQERPLLQARTGEFATVVGEQIRRELQPLGADSPTVAHMQLASFLDLSWTLHHQAQVRSAAHPAALEKIDAGDVASLCDFLTVVAGRLPLSAAEFDRFLELARGNWREENDKDVLLRGRVVTSSLAGKASLLQTWVTPFVRELAARGLLVRVAHQYRAARRGAQSTEVIRPRGAAAAGASVLSDDTQELAASDTGIHILEGTPEPARLHVLRNYVRCATVCAVVSLDEALRIAQAQPDVPGHRQYVIRLFHDEGWIMSPRGRGEPVFEKRGLPLKTGQTAIPAATRLQT